MTRLSLLRSPVAAARYAATWIALAVPLGVVVGTAVALFLVSLDTVTQARFDHPWLLWTLPVLGLASGLMYHAVGRAAERGNNLILDEIHQPGGGVPVRMTPLVLVGTLLTHLGGGSAGREGTAVQMGGSLAGFIARSLRLTPEVTRTLLTAGIAAGFGAVFGTPLTGAVFAIEVLTVGRFRHQSLWPCLVASLAGDWVCSAWNVQWAGRHFSIHHTHYAVSSITATAPKVDLLLLAKIAFAAVAFGLASALFARLTHRISAVFKSTIRYGPLRPFVGGLIVIAMAYAVGTRDYLGLGVVADPNSAGGVSIVNTFVPGGATPWSWAWKLLFTAVTIGSGFKGGEVTPLFFIGATLGHALAVVLHAPIDLFAALGFVAVFAGATNTPVACTIMGIELFGTGGSLTPAFVVYLAVACGVAYLFSGHSGIYAGQRVVDDKHLAAVESPSISQAGDR